MPSTKRALLIALSLLGLLGFNAAAWTETALENIQKTKLIKIAIPTDYAPYGFVGLDLKL
jgi:polar amino acid transport system substrate-binding protein